MKLYIFKVFSRNMLKMVGILFVFMLISLLIISPSAISYAERDRQFRARLEALKNHLILIYTLENIEGLSTYEVIDYVSSLLDDLTILNESLIGISYESIRIKLDSRPPFSVIAYYPQDKIGDLLDLRIVEGALDIGPGKIVFNADLLGMWYEDVTLVGEVDRELGVGSEIILIGLDGKEYTFEISGLYAMPQIGDLFMGVPTTPRLNSIVSLGDFDDLVGDGMDSFILYLILKFDSEALKGGQFLVMERFFNVSQTINKGLGEKFNVQSYETIDNVQRIFFMQTFSDIASITLTAFYSFPYVFGIWFLTVVNLELIIRSFRRDIGLLQLRGLSNKVVRRYFLVFMFIVASAGIALGIIVSPYVGNLIVGYLGYDPLPTTVFYSLESVITAFILGYILLFIAYLRRVGLLKDISPISIARKYFEPFERSTWNPSSLFLIFFILAIVKMVEWGFAINLNEYITGFGPLSVILIIYGVVSSFMSILAPIIIVYGVINLVIYRTNLISKLTELFSFILARRFKGIVYRYSGRLPGLISKTTFLSGLLISLMLYYVIFSGRTLYFLDGVSNVNNRLGEPVYLMSMNIDPSRVEELRRFIGEVLEKEGLEDYYIGISIPGSVQVLGNIFGLSYLYVDDINEFLRYAGIEDWMIVRYRDDLDILLDRFIVNNIEDEIGGDVKDLKIQFEIRLSSFLDGRNLLEFEDYVDGYLGVDFPSLIGRAIIDRDILDIGELNSTFEGRIYIFSSQSKEVSVILRSYMVDLKRYGVITVSSLSQYSDDFPLSDMMSFLQKNLYSFNVYAIIAVSIAIALLSVEYVMDMIPDLIVMRSRGLASASKRLAYSLIVPITLFSVLIGLIVGIIAGYGASQQTISTLSDLSPNLPLFIDVLAPLYLGIVVFISLLIPYLILSLLHRRYVREVVHFG